MAEFTYDHIHLRSPDPEATAAFYERMFGAQILRSVQGGQPRIDLKLGGVDVFIMPVAPGSNVNPPPVSPYQGLDHFGLRVNGIDAVVADFKAKGVHFTMEPTARSALVCGSRSCAVRRGVDRAIDRNAA